MSNPDSPDSSYWQEPDDPGYRSARSSRHGRTSAGGDARADGGFGRTGHAGGGQAGSNGASRNGYSEYSGERTGRFSQTADDLRNRLGMRGSVLGRDRNGAGRSGSGQGAQNGGARNGSARDGYGDPDYGARSSRGSAADFWTGETGGRTDSRTNGYRGARRAGAAGAEQGGYYDDGRTGPRTALRERTGQWVADRTDSWRAARGGGNGRYGGGNGRNGGRGGGPHGRGGLRESFRTGRWWRHWTIKKALAVAGSCIALVILAGIGVMVMLYERTPIPTDVQLTATEQSSVVYFGNGKQMGTFDGGGIDRQLLTSSQIPTVMTQAMTAAEDRHFYTEGGVSVTGLARSMVEDVFGNGNLQGGSTITMQYAKNYYNDVNTGRNIKTKLKEIFIATKLGHYRSKQWVMTNYLNVVPFGNTTDGLGAAAENYFDINLTNGGKLSIAQAAMLAAMPNSPAFYNPDPTAGAGYTALVARWHYVLTNMVRDGNITQAQANAQTFPKLTPPPSGNGETGYTGYLMNMVLQQLEAPKADGGYGLTQQQVDTKGYKIKTTFNLTKVKQLARTINQSKAAIRTVNGTKFPGYDRFGSVIEDSKTGAIIAIYGGPGYGAPNCKVTDCDLNMAEAAEPVGSSFKTYVLAAAVQEGMDVFSSKLNGYSPIWIPIGPTDTATQMQNSPLSRPPGCGAPKNLAVCFSTNGTTYRVFDETSENSNAPLAVNEAAAISSDPAFEDLAHRDGISSVVSMAKEFGVGQNSFVNPCPTSEERHDSTVGATIADCNDMTGPAPSNTVTGNGLALNFDPNSTDKAAHYAGTPGSVAIALGENPLTPIEQASTFATLADDGVYHTPHVIAAISQNGASIPLNVKTRQVLNPQQAADVDYALSFDNNNSQGTAQANIPYRRGDVIGKTGTIGEQELASQAWFIGGLPRGLAMSVALFTNLPGNQNLDNLLSAGGTQGSQGGAWPAFTWNAYMTKYNNNAPQIALTTFPQKSGPPFSTWILVKAKKVKLPTCRPFQFTNCTQPKNCNNPFGHGNGNGNGNCNPNGNNSPSPNPSSSCNPFQQQCTSPSPSVSPSPSCTPNGPGGGGCTSQQPGVAGTTTSMSIGSLSSDQVTTLAEVMALKQRALVIPAVT